MAKETILIVEDDGILALHVRDQLTELGYTVLAPVASGEEALKTTAAHRPDLVLMDIKLKGALDGITTSEKIHEMSDIPIVFLTAYAQPELLQKAKATAPYGYLVKPVQERELAATIDIALQRHSVDRKLKESEERFRSLFEQSNDAIFIHDDQGHVLNVNQRAEEMLGYSREELLALPTVDYHPAGTIADAMSAFNELLTSGHVRFDSKFRKKDGTEIDVSLSVREVGSGARLFQAIVRDITERKLAEEALRQAQKLESLGTLAGGIAHDFNNLLNAVLGQVTLALGKLPPENNAVANLIKATKATDRAADLTRQLLAYSGKGTFATENIDINGLVTENVRILEVAVPKTAQLRYELDSPAPWVNGDASQIQQVIMNLIINSGEAIGTNPGQITVRTSRIEIPKGDSQFSKYTNQPLTQGTYARIQVSDTGIGMNADLFSRIFDPFFTTKFVGRGLGLAAVLGIVRSHHGGIRIESEETKGTQFDVILPLVEAQAPVRPKPPEQESRMTGEGITILVIDDEPFVLELLTDIFTEAKYTVLAASNPMEGIELYRQHQHRIAAVILDYSMPGMNGKEAFNQLTKINRDVKVLLCSGYQMDAIALVFEKERPFDFIQKPYKPALLLEGVQRIRSLVRK